MTVKSADKKPEKYMGPDGKVKYRMVPVDREVMSKEAAVKEVSKGMVGRYLKKVPASAADAGRKSSGAMGIGPEDQKKQMKKGISQFVNRQRGTTMAVDKMTGKAKVAATDSYNFVIPEDIPVGERNAFMGAAAAAHKSGKSHFNFGGKKHPVTMKKDTAKAVNSSTTEGTDEAKRVVYSDKPDRLVTMKIKNPNPKKKPGETATMNPKMATADKGKASEMEQKEGMSDNKREADRRSGMGLKNRMMDRARMRDTAKPEAEKRKEMQKRMMPKESLTIRDKLLMVLEGDRAAHYKGATEPEEMDSKMSPGGKKMKADVEKGMAPNDTLKKAFDDVTKAGQAGPKGKARPNDKQDGDKKMMTPDDITKKAGMKEETRDQLAGIKAAYAEMMNGN